MRPKEIQDILNRRPFLPLYIYLSDGTRYEIRHPDQVLVYQARLDIGVQASRDGAPERTEYVSIIHVVRIVPIAAEGTKKETFTVGQN